MLLVWPKRPFQGALLQKVVRAEDPMELIGGNNWPFQKVKVKGKGKDQFFYKRSRQRVSVLCSNPDQEPHWSEESRSAEGGAWNPIGAVSKVKDEVHCKWSARGESSHQHHAQEEHSNERAANDEEYEKDAHHCWRTPIKGRRTRRTWRRMSRTFSRRKAGRSR